MTAREFTGAYLASRGWDKPVVLDEELMIEYPICLYTFEDRRVFALAPEIEEGMELVDPQAELDQVLQCLFDLDQVRAVKESVTGFYAPRPQIGERLPAIADEGALADLFQAMDETDSILGEVTAADDFTCCILENGRMLAAAGAVRMGKIADISVAVHPECRGQGLGARVTAALIRKIQGAGCVALYRAQHNNLPSLRLAQGLGLRRGFLMEGVQLIFPQEDILAP